MYCLNLNYANVVSGRLFISDLFTPNKSLQKNLFKISRDFFSISFLCCELE